MNISKVIAILEEYQKNNGDVDLFFQNRKDMEEGFPPLDFIKVNRFEDRGEAEHIVLIGMTIPNSKD